MYGNFGQDLARARMNDRLREAAAYRLTRETREARASERRAALRRVRSSVLSVILWPVRH
jgi:hypothetical protein